MAKKIAIINFKGGVGKTTTTINLAAGINILGKRVLVIDLDPQVNASYILGFDEGEEQTVYDSLCDKLRRTPLPRYEYSKGFDLCPASKRMSQAEKDLGDHVRKEEKLKNLLIPFEDEYDYIIMDCPPNLGILTINAMCAADSLIIPINRPLAFFGMGDILQKIEELKVDANPELTIEGFLLTDYNKRVNIVGETKEAMERIGVAKTFNARIRHNERLSEMPKHRQHIFEYDSKSIGAEDYIQLAHEVTGIKVRSKSTKR